MTVPFLGLPLAAASGALGCGGDWEVRSSAESHTTLQWCLRSAASARRRASGPPRVPCSPVATRHSLGRFGVPDKNPKLQYVLEVTAFVSGEDGPGWPTLVSPSLPYPYAESVRAEPRVAVGCQHRLGTPWVALDSEQTSGWGQGDSQRALLIQVALWSLGNGKIVETLHLEVWCLPGLQQTRHFYFWNYLWVYRSGL